MTKLKNKWILSAIAILLVILTAFLLILRYPPSWLVEEVIKYEIGERHLELDDGLHAFIAGSGAPMPDEERAGPSTAVVAGEHIFIVDTGDGSTRNIEAAGLEMNNVDAVFLTHFHSDHIGGLGETMLQRWANGGYDTPLPVYGPNGVDGVVEGFNAAYTLDTSYRVAHHGADVMPPSGAGGAAMAFDLGNDPMASKVVYEKDGVTVTAFNVDHSPVTPAVGYRFEYKGRSLVISGDTVYTPNLIEQSKGVDLLICEALNPDLVGLLNKNSDILNGATAASVTADIPDYHITPQQAALTAQEAGAKELVLTHILPPIPSLVKNVFLGDAKEYYDGKITVVKDGLLLSLPADSEKIERQYLL